MEIGIDDLDFNDELDDSQNQDSQDQQRDSDGDVIKPWIGEDSPQNTTEPEPTEEPKEQIDDEPPTPQEDVLTLYLKSKNINPEKIKFEDEDGSINEKDWNSLTQEEQLNILSTTNEDTDYSLDDNEVNLINQLRLNQMTPEEFIEYTKQQGVQEYVNSLSDQNQYQIDNLTDDELFILDLQSRIEEISDEEAKVALEKQKENPELFSKQMQGIRQEYKAKEKELLEAQEIAEQQQNAANFEAFQNSVLESIQSLDRIGNLDIEMDDDDMNEIANFILSKDNAGVSYLAKALNDPQTLVRMAWFALKGDEAIDSITEYFTNQIKEVSKTRYEEGLKASKNNTKPKTDVVITAFDKNKKNKQELSIDDLD